MRLAANTIFLVLILLAWAGSSVVSAPLSLGEEPVRVLDGGELAVLQDPSRAMSLEDVRQAQADGRFRPIDGNLGLGYIPEAAWLHLDLRVSATSPVTRWLEVVPSYLDDIQLFHLDPSGTLDHRVGGDMLPQSVKEVQYRNTLFKLDLQPGEHQLYIRLQTTSTLAAIVKLWQPDAFEQQQRIDYFSYGLYFSLIFTVLLFNLVNGLVTWRPIFFVYVGYLALNSLQWLSINGFVAEFLFAQQPLLANLTLGLSLSLAAAITFVFYIMILELRIYHPFLYRISQAGVGVALLTALATPLGYYQTFAPLLFWIGIAIIALAPGPIQRLWKTGEWWSRLLALAYAIYCLLVCINLLGVMKILPFSERISHAGMASNIFHILFLHFAILLHFRRVEKAHAQALQETALACRELELEKGFRHEQGQLLAMLSHELKNPLATVRMSVDAITAAPGDSQRRGRIERSLTQINTIIERCALADRLEQGALEPHLSRCDIVGMVTEIIETSGNPQRIQLEASPRLPEIYSDAMLLAVAISNLIDNALKYSPPDSRVSVTITQGTPGADSEALRGIQLTVSNLADPGDLPDPERLFGKFYRGSRAQGQSGSGLGLYLAKGITVKLGGQLSHYGNHPQVEFILWIPETLS